ncbi:Translation initiation factor eIF-2B subunit epsilon [Branchiostoma belcheri]|nr:Translation initiation factor eIF-2B subunit epsilon [Branchiostoma belcheri]
MDTVRYIWGGGSYRVTWAGTSGNQVGNMDRYIWGGGSYRVTWTDEDEDSLVTSMWGLRLDQEESSSEESEESAEEEDDLDQETSPPLDDMRIFYTEVERHTPSYLVPSFLPAEGRSESGYRDSFNARR